MDAEGNSQREPLKTREPSLEDLAERSQDLVVRDVEGVSIPFASPKMLWRMKHPTKRAKDEPDLMFLAEWFKQNGQEPPKV